MTDFSPPDQAVLKPDSQETQRLLTRSREAWDKLHEQVSRVVVGQDEVVEEVFLALFTRGHALLVGVPGLAKTLLVSTVARS
ncbi:MAG: AAA family ATPase, partial [Phycisphaeraceae bacterium]